MKISAKRTILSTKSFVRESLKTQHHITKFFKIEPGSKNNNKQKDEREINHRHYFLIKFNTLGRLIKFKSLIRTVSTLFIIIIIINKTNLVTSQIFFLSTNDIKQCQNQGLIGLAIIFIYPVWDVKVDSVIDEISESNRLRIFYVLFLADF